MRGMESFKTGPSCVRPHDRVAQQALADGINDEIQRFERQLADKHRTGIGNLRDLDGANTVLDGKTDSLVHIEPDQSAARACLSLPKQLQSELLYVTTRNR